MHRATTFRSCLIAAMITACSTIGFSHPGGLDKNGGHTDKKTGEYHYHKPKGTGAENSEPPAPATEPKTPKPSLPTPVLPPVIAPLPKPEPPVVKVEAIATAVAAPQPQDYARSLADLIDPSKLAGLKAHGAKPRLEQAVALLEQANLEGASVPALATNAVKLAGYTNAVLAAMTCDSLIRNHQVARELGVLTVDGLEELRRGQSPKIANGAFGGDALSVAHTVPFAVAPELDNLIANLELLPAKVTSAKGEMMGKQQYELTRQFQIAGLLTTARVNEILAK